MSDEKDLTSVDPPELRRSLERWLIAGAVALLVLIAAFPAYLAVESTRRDDALQRRRSALLQTGGELWQANCGSCHGTAGQGPGAPALNAKEFLSGTVDRRIHHIISAGIPGSAMAAWSVEFGGSLTDDEIVALVTYIRNWEDTAPSNPNWRNPGQAATFTPTPPPTSPAPSSELTITISDVSCEPTELRVAPGKPFTLVLHNRGREAAGIELHDFEVHIDAGPGETLRRDLLPLDPGEYRFDCLGRRHKVLAVGKIIAGELSGHP